MASPKLGALKKLIEAAQAELIEGNGLLGTQAVERRPRSPSGSPIPNVLTTYGATCTDNEFR